MTAYLRAAGAEARVEEFSTGTPTAAAAAEAVGCHLRQIVKSLVFECDGQAVLAMVPGDRRADPDKVAAAAGGQRAVVSKRVLELTGFEPGAVAPFPLPRIQRVFMDRNFLTCNRVWIGAGSTRHLAGLSPADLARLARAVPLDLVSDD